MDCDENVLARRRNGTMNLPLRQSIGWDGWELAKVPGRAPSMPCPCPCPCPWPWPSCRPPTIGPDWPQSINQSFRGSMRLGQAWLAWGNHLDGDGAWQRAHWSSYCTSAPSYSARRTKYRLRLRAQSRPHGTGGRAPCLYLSVLRRPSDNAVPNGLVHHVACTYAGPQVCTRRIDLARNAGCRRAINSHA